METQAEKVRLALQDFVNQETGEVSRALEELRRDGYVEEISGDEQPVFRLKPSRN